MAKPYRRKDSKFWWIAPIIDGIQVPQSAKTTDYERAQRKLKILEGRVAGGAPLHAKTDRGDLSVLLELVRTDYKIKGRASLVDLERRIDKHLVPALGHLPANAVGPLLAEYAMLRKGEGAANASINQEFAILKRAYRLGMRCGLVSTVPAVEMLPAKAPRQTAYTDKQFDSIVEHADTLTADILLIYGYTGWRKQSVLTMEWSQVDLEDDWIILRAEQTKNKKATRFPLIEPLKEIFIRRRAETDTLQKKLRRVIPWVFHRNGNRVRSIRKGFETARADAGLPGHNIHDFRRTAVRALHDLNYDIKTIMDLCGFKTTAMVLRYIGMTSDDKLKAAGSALATRRTRKRV